MTVDEAELEKLRAEAGELLRSWTRSRPVFVEFAGTPKSGKSTCIDIVSHFFRRLGYKILAPTEGASKRTPYYLKDDLVAYNAWSATYALAHILEGYYGSDDYQLVIMDRGLFDALAWFELLSDQGKVNKEECSTIQDFLLVDHWRKFIDIVFSFHTDPDTSLERETKDKLIDEPGQAMNPTFLGELNGAYQTITDKYSTQFHTLHVLNTSGDQKTTPQATAINVAEKIIEYIRSGVE